jgi:hypothetical protein
MHGDVGEVAVAAMDMIDDRRIRPAGAAAGRQPGDDRGAGAGGAAQAAVVDQEADLVGEDPAGPGKDDVLTLAVARVGKAGAADQQPVVAAGKTSNSAA